VLLYKYKSVISKSAFSLLLQYLHKFPYMYVLKSAVSKQSIQSQKIEHDKDDRVKLHACVRSKCERHSTRGSLVEMTITTFALHSDRTRLITIQFHPLIVSLARTTNAMIPDKQVKQQRCNETKKTKPRLLFLSQRNCSPCRTKTIVIDLVDLESSNRSFPHPLTNH
jgi:hypothetical protein